MGLSFSLSSARKQRSHTTHLSRVEKFCLSVCTSHHKPQTTTSIVLLVIAVDITTTLVPQSLDFSDFARHMHHPVHVSLNPRRHPFDTGPQQQQQHQQVAPPTWPLRSVRYRNYVETAADRLAEEYTRPDAAAKLVLAGHAHDVLGLSAVQASRWVWGGCSNVSHAESASGLLRTCVVPAHYPYMDAQTYPLVHSTC